MSMFYYEWQIVSLLSLFLVNRISCTIVPRHIYTSNESVVVGYKIINSNVC